MLLATLDKPQTEGELQRRLRISAKELREWLWLQVFVFGGVSAGIACALLMRDWWFALVLFLSVFVPFFPVYRFIHRRMRENRDRLLAAADEMDRTRGALAR